MCGRYVTAKAASDLVADFGARELVGEDTRPSWNVAPTQRVPIVTERLEKNTGEIVRRIETARWGLVPAWAKDPSVGSRVLCTSASPASNSSDHKTAVCSHSKPRRGAGGWLFKI